MNKTLTAESALKILMEFPGWGNSNKSIWHVGIEEKGGFTNEDGSINAEFKNEQYEIILNRYTMDRGIQEFDYNDISKYYKEQFYDNISRLMCSILNLNIPWIDYKRDYLARNTSNLAYNSFITNIYPLGKPDSSREAWQNVNKCYKYLFQLDSYDDYIKKLQIYKRKEMLFDLWKKSKPHLTLLWGFHEETFFPEEITTTFKKGNSILRNKKVYFDYEYFRYNDDQLIIKTYHISRFLPRIIEFLNDKLKLFLGKKIWDVK